MSAFAGKGKGKTKGKDKGGKGKTPGGGHTLPRTRLSAEKFSGEVTAWKGKYGWIKASEEIEHEKAKLRDGSLFASQDDIEGGAALEAGTKVEFHIWEDDTGLGAEEITVVGKAKGKGKTLNPSKGVTKGATKGSAWSSGGKAADSWNASSKGSWSTGKGSWDASSAKGGWGAASAKGSWGAAAKGSWGAAKGAWGAASAKGSWDSWSKGGKGVANGWDKYGAEKGKGKGKDGKTRGQGHKLPRTRISAEKFTGTVTAWKGKYGWIKPAEEISHEKAKLHNGGLFVSVDDLEGGLTELTKDSTVEFHIWEDSSGLGAEEVVQY